MNAMPSDVTSPSLSDAKPFNRLCIVGLGLIGSSIARAVRTPPLPHGKIGPQVVPEITGTDISQEIRERAQALNIFDSVKDDLASAVEGADLIILCAPVRRVRELSEELAPILKGRSVTVSDVGSTKRSVLRDFAPLIDAGISVIPAHPMAGTEQSGPEAGFAEMFADRWCVLTPIPGTPEQEILRLAKFWQDLGMQTDEMEPDIHDRILSITSHIPHIIAYTAVGTIHDLDSQLDEQVFRFAAGGFRDMTRLAGSDPIMWRDICLENRDYILEMLQLFTENLFALQRAIRFGDGDGLHTYFSETREIHQRVIREKQAEMEDVKSRRIRRAREATEATLKTTTPTHSRDNTGSSK